MVRPGYKQTEVGVIPEEWEVKPLGSVISKGRLGGNYANQDAEAELPLMKMGNLARGYFDLSKVQFITPGVRPEGPHRLVHGDVLFNTRNTLDLVGKVAIWRDELPVAYYNSNLMRLEFDPEQVCSNEYANYALNTEGAVSRLRALATGTTSVAAIYTRDLMKLQVLVPPLLEQRAIAEALSDVDALLGALDRLIAKKRDLKQAAMQQLLTGQTRLPGFRGEWEVKRLGDLATFFKGKGLPKSALSESGAEPCIHCGELFTRYPETIGVIFSRTDTPEGVFRSVANDVLMPTSDVTPKGLAKASCVRVDGVILGGDILVIRSDTNRVHGPFLSLVIRYEETQVLQLVTGSTVYHLYGSDMRNFTFSMPPLPEQTAIAEVLTDMDAELAALEQRREKTRALKQAMMQELLTGRTRLI
jgi:type I restriction enzyme S subunit